MLILKFKTVDDGLVLGDKVSYEFEGNKLSLLDEEGQNDDRPSKDQGSDAQLCS